MRRVRDVSQYRNRVKRDDIKDCVKNVLGNLFVESPGVMPINLLPAVGTVAGSTIVDLQTGTPSSLAIPALLSVAAAAVMKCQVTYDGNGSDALSSLISGGTASQSSGIDPAKVCDGNLGTNNNITSYGNQWWKYDFGSGVTKKFGQISIYNGGNQGFCPKNMIFQGSNDDTNWTDLDSFLVSNTGSQWSTHGVNSGDYRYYRCFFIDNYYGSGNIYLWEIRFYYATGDPNWYESGATVTVRDNCFIKTGKTFSKWNTAADGSGTDYDPADTFAITAPTTLYAIWV